jgi:hypothetical protein
MGWIEQSWNALLLCLRASKGRESGIICVGIAGSTIQGENSVFLFVNVFLGTISY